MEGKLYDLWTWQWFVDYDVKYKLEYVFDG